MLTVIEKVLLLQDADIFKDTTTENLSHIAAITEEVDFSANEIIYKEGEASDCMYLVVEGAIRLDRGNQQVMIAKAKDVIGTWALFDDEPRVVTATALEDSMVLRIDRDEFYDLLADHTQITQGVLKTLSKRLKGLLGRVRTEFTPGR